MGWIPSGVLAMVPGGQHSVLPIARGLGQQTRPIVLADDRDPLLWTSRRVVVTQTSSSLQQLASPQHVSFSLGLQHVLPQHCSPLSQQVFPQQVCVDLQQWSPSQHFSGFFPLLQQSRPQVSVPQDSDTHLFESCSAWRADSNALRSSCRHRGSTSTACCSRSTACAQGSTCRQCPSLRCRACRGRHRLTRRSCNRCCAEGKRSTRSPAALLAHCSSHGFGLQVAWQARRRTRSAWDRNRAVADGRLAPRLDRLRCAEQGVGVAELGGDKWDTSLWQA